MANKLALTTVGTKWILVLDADPSTGGGFTAPIGSEALVVAGGVGSMWAKFGATDTSWRNMWEGGGGAGLTNNYAATTAPAVGNDNTQGYAAGSYWLNTTTGIFYHAVSVATGAAVWREMIASNGTTQNLTNKSIITPARSDCKQDTKANLLTYVATATNGQYCFATDEKIYYVVKDATLVSLGTNDISPLTSSAAAIAISMLIYDNFSHTLSENTTLQNPTNMIPGRSGVITFTQNATAAKTLALGTNWKTTDGAVIALSTTLGAVNELVYYVESATRISCTLFKFGIT